jgi:hypothetical protein
MLMALLASCSDKDEPVSAARNEPAETSTSVIAPADTTTTIPANQASVTVVSDYPGRLLVKLNGVDHVIEAPGRIGPFGVVPHPDRNDSASVTDESGACGGGDSEHYFTAGQSYELRITTIQTDERCPGNNLPFFSAFINPGNHQIA